MLPYSQQPQIIRLHNLEELQRTKFVGEFCQTAYEWFPHHFSSLLPFFGDAYYTFISIYKCDRRLGEQYTYISKYISKHYEEEGQLMNKKYRTLMFVLELVQRHTSKFIIKRILQRISNSGQKLKQIKEIVIGDAETFIANGRWFMLMIFMLGWNKSYNLVDSILGTRYVYTFKNKNKQNANYKIEGWLLFTVFLVKGLRTILNLHTLLTKKKKQIAKEVQESQTDNEEQLCRICYDQIRNKSSTSCGHVFCWDCIIKYVGGTEECPVCRSRCLAREIVQLQNY